MRPSVVLERNREAIRMAAKRNRMANPRVFGSVLHGEDHENSDLDLLVDALPGATPLDIGGLHEELEAMLDIRIDVRTPADLPTKWRGQVMAEAKPV